MLQVSWLKPLFVTVPMAALTLPATVTAAETAPIPDAATLLPDNTAYTILLDMRDETWQQLEQYAFFQQWLAQGAFSLDPGGLPFLPMGLDYQADIAPWVGDTAALALMPLDQPRTIVFEEHEVMILPIADPNRFEGFINKVADLRGTAPETQPYQTFDILYWEPEFLESETIEPSNLPPTVEPMPSIPEPETVPAPEESSLKALPEGNNEVPLPEEPEPSVPGLAIAILPDFIITAAHPAAIRSWIDQRPDTAAEALAANPRFLRTLAHPNYDGSLGALYGSVSELMNYALTDFPLPDLPFEIPLPLPLSPQDAAQLAAFQLDSSIEVLIYPSDRGIRVQGRGYYDDTLLQTLPLPLQPAPSEVLDYVPSDSYGLLSGQNLATTWQEIATSLDATETTRGFLQQARSFFTTFTGLDLDRDIFSWMDQGFSLFLFPTEETPLTTLFPELHIGLGVALQTSDRAKAEATFAALDEHLGTSFVTVEPNTFNDHSITSWGAYLDADDQPDSFLGRSWASEDTLVLTTSLASLTDILELEPTQVLPNSLQFLRATKEFPTDNQGHLYINTSSIQRLFYRFFPIEPNDSHPGGFHQLAGSVQALSGTLSFTEDYLQIDGLLMLVPTDPRSLAPSSVTPQPSVED